MPSVTFSYCGIYIKSAAANGVADVLMSRRACGFLDPLTPGVAHMTVASLVFCSRSSSSCHLAAKAGPSEQREVC